MKRGQGEVNREIGAVRRHKGRKPRDLRRGYADGSVALVLCPASRFVPLHRFGVMMRIGVKNNLVELFVFQCPRAPEIRTALDMARPARDVGLSVFIVMEFVAVFESMCRDVV